MSDQPSSGSGRVTGTGARTSASLREATTGDASAVARVFVDCWKEGYHGVLPTAYAAGLSYEEQADSWRRVIALPGNVTLVAEDADGQVMAFLSGGPERSARSRFFAEIYGLYVLPEFRGRRLGRQLLGQLCAELLTIGLRTLTVRVLEANPIRGFYEALGGQEQESRPVRIVGRSLNEVAYGWTDIRPLANLPIHGNQA